MSALPDIELPPGSRPEDQASGLRAFFGSSFPPVYVIACPPRCAAVLPWIHTLDRSAAARGRKVAWLDEIDMARREGWPLAAAVKFDLSQALLDHVPLSSTLVAGGSGWWYASARRVHRLPALMGPTVDQRLSDSGVSFDAVVISADAGLTPNSATVYANHAHHVVVTGHRLSDLKQTRDWIVTRDAVRSAADWRLVVWGSKDQAATSELWLQEATAGLTLEPISLLGHVEAQSDEESSVAALWVGRSAKAPLEAALAQYMGLD